MISDTWNNSSPKHAEKQKN